MTCTELPSDEIAMTGHTTTEQPWPFPAVNRARLRAPRVKAVPRARLDAILDEAWDHRVTLILAPAGSGKTTAVVEFARRAPAPLAWVTCSGVDSEASFVAHVNAALDQIVPGLCFDVPDVSLTLEALGQVSDPVVLVVDDVHLLVGTPAEAALERLVNDAPDAVRFVLAGRREPGFDLKGLRLMGQLLSITNEELRFRVWEAEHLFRDLYETWLRPDDIARLAQRVDGWAAGLQMFHLAARGLNPIDQRRLIDRLNGRARIVREYLVANVLGPISPELRAFLIDTCVVDTVTPELADELRGATGSADHLDELAASQLFTVTSDDDNYRYHEVLRAQLEVMLLERDGPTGAAARYRFAGTLLERRSLAADAMRCYARAGDWASVRRLAGASSERVLPGTATWIRDLPGSIVADDPWLLLARSRAEHLAGRWSAAAESFRAAATKGIGADFADQLRPQVAALTAWIDPMALPPDGWIGPARAGCHRDPAVAATALGQDGSPDGLVAAAALHLLAGDVHAARQLAEPALSDERTSAAATAAGLTVLALGGLLTGQDGAAADLDAAESSAERAGFGWLARIARAALSLTDRPSGVDEAIRVRDQCAADGDAWGAGISSLVAGLGAARRGTAAVALLEQAASRFRLLQARSFEAVCMLAIAACDPSANDAAQALARATGTRGITGLIEGFVGPAPRLRQPSMIPIVPSPAAEASSASPLQVHCFGSFAVSVRGRVLDIDVLRPRARTLLKMLAVHADTGLHRESIVEALWPDSTLEAGIRNLQVAVSAIRRMLATAGVPDAYGIRRQGEAYRLVLPCTDASDLAQFLELAAEARATAARDERDRAMDLAVRALGLYRGELLAEDGPLEFIVRDRARVGALRQGVAAIVADGHIVAGDHGAAIDVCEATILEHPYADELWRLLVLAHRARGDHAAAGQVEARYQQVLDELMT